MFCPTKGSSSLPESSAQAVSIDSMNSNLIPYNAWALYWLLVKSHIHINNCEHLTERLQYDRHGVKHLKSIFSFLPRNCQVQSGPAPELTKPNLRRYNEFTRSRSEQGVNKHLNLQLDSGISLIANMDSIRHLVLFYLLLKFKVYVRWEWHFLIPMEIQKKTKQVSVKSLVSQLEELPL